MRLKFRQQHPVSPALLAQRRDLFREVFCARAVGLGFLGIALVKPPQIVVQTLVHRLDELLQRVLRKVAVLVMT
jgi:hypothetical protein